MVEIAEDEEEGSTIRDQSDVVTPTNSIPKRQASLKEIDLTKKEDTSAAEAERDRLMREEVRAKALSSSPSSDTKHPVTNSSFSSVPRMSADFRASTSSARPSMYELGEGNSYSKKPKVRIGARPSLDPGKRPHTAGSLSTVGEGRPVSTLPPGIRLAPRKNDTSRPKSQRSIAPPIAGFTPPPIPQTTGISTPVRPTTSPGKFSSSASVPIMTKSNAVTPEKQRLMKALQLRKRQMNKPEEAKEQKVDKPLADVPQSGDAIDPTEPPAASPNTKSEDTVTTLDTMTKQDSEVSMRSLDEQESMQPRRSDSSPISGAESLDIESTEASSISETADQHTLVVATEVEVLMPVEKEGDISQEELPTSADSAKTLSPPLENLQEPVSVEIPDGQSTPDSPKDVDGRLVSLEEESVSKEVAEGAALHDDDTQTHSSPESPKASESIIIPQGEAVDDGGSEMVILPEDHHKPQNLPEPLDFTEGQRVAPLEEHTDNVGSKGTESSLPNKSPDLSKAVAEIYSEIVVVEASQDEQTVINGLPDQERTLDSHSLTQASSSGTAGSDALTPDPIKHDRKKKRRGIIDPIRTNVPAESSDDNFLSDDSFMDELDSAVVHEAQPISVTRSPIQPSFPSSPSQVGQPEGSPMSLRSVSNPPESTLSVKKKRFSSELGVLETARTVSASHLNKARSPKGPVPIAKKVNVSSGISQRIKALEMRSASNTLPISTSASPTSSPAFQTLRNQALSAPISRSGSAASRQTTVGKLSPSQSPSSSPEQPTPPARSPISPLPNHNLAFDKPVSKPQLRSVSVTARIIRDPKGKNLPGSDAKPDVPLELYESPLIVEHQPAIPTLNTTMIPSSDGPTSPVAASPSQQEPDQRRGSTSSRRSTSSRGRSEPRSSPPAGPSPDNASKDKKEGRRESAKSRLLRRMSSLSSQSRKSLNHTVSPTVEEEDPTVEMENFRGSRTKSTTVPIGEVNVQFPDNLVSLHRNERQHKLIMLSAMEAEVSESRQSRLHNSYPLKVRRSK